MAKPPLHVEPDETTDSRPCRHCVVRRCPDCGATANTPVVDFRWCVRKGCTTLWFQLEVLPVYHEMGHQHLDKGWQPFGDATATVGRLRSTRVIVPKTDESRKRRTTR